MPSPERVAAERQPCDGVEAPGVPGATAAWGHARSCPSWLTGPRLRSDLTLDRKSLPWEPRPLSLPLPCRPAGPCPGARRTATMTGSLCAQWLCPTGGAETRPWGPVWGSPPLGGLGRGAVSRGLCFVGPWRELACLLRGSPATWAASSVAAPARLSWGTDGGHRSSSETGRSR